MLGNKIKYLRKNKNITQSQLAKVLGVSTGAVGLWELDKRKPDAEVLIEIAKFFNVTVDYLINNDKDNTVTIIGKNGYYQKYVLTEDKIKALEVLAETLSEKNVNDNRQNK